ncbi:hypothetical protein HN873_024596 [Arachis hypogaea]
MPLRSLPPWQLKKKTAMARRCTSRRSSCLPLLLQHVATSHFASPSAMTVPRCVLVFVASSLQHAIASLLCPLLRWQRRSIPSVISQLRPLKPWQRRTLETLLELSADGHISVFPFTMTSSFHDWLIRFLRRTEGVEAARKYFLDARESPSYTYHVYVAYATMTLS